MNQYTKACGQCENSFPVEAYGKGYHCKSCMAANRRDWYSRNRERAILASQDYNVKKWGFSCYAEYQEALKKQKDCAICGEELLPKDAAVDHCHKTGKVREFLCNNCNNGLGRFKDDPIRLQSAMEYLKKHE